MRAPATYRLLHQLSGTQQTTRSASAAYVDTVSYERSASPKNPPRSLVLKKAISAGAESATKTVEAMDTSHLLGAEQLRLKHGLSGRELASVLATAETIFKPPYADATLPGSVKEKEDIKRWEEAVRLSSEHTALRPVVECRQRRKRDSETKVAIQERHPEIEKELRGGYPRAVRRLEAFQQATALPFPPRCGVFMDW